jgi:FkbM family methyltransferase
MRKKYPISAKLQNGNCIAINNESALHFLTHTSTSRAVKVDLNEDNATIIPSLLESVSENTQPVILNGITNSDLISVYIKNEYQNLPVKGKIVIDIGAQIADSSIYFALKEASKIIAIEPFFKNYMLAKHNVYSNNLQDKIVVMLARCEGRSQRSIQGDSYIDILPKEDTVTLDNILNKNNILGNEIILKMDCEGYEYEIIRTSSRELLRRFEYIQIEYHSGYKNLKEKLEKNGFSVQTSKPIAKLVDYEPKSYMVSKYEKGDWQYLGYLWAKRLD